MARNVLAFSEDRELLLQLLGKGKELADSLGGELNVLLAGSDISDFGELARYGSKKTLVAEGPGFEHFSIENEIDRLKYPNDIWELNPQYLSYYVQWSGFDNYMFAKRRGFQDLRWEWQREGYIEGFNQIDTIGYLFHEWMKWPKYGHASVTDLASYWIREGRITRDESIQK